MPSLSFVPFACAAPSNHAKRISLPLTCEPSAAAAAFLLTDDLAITAYHCVRAATKISLTGHSASIRVISSSADLAILQLPGPLQNAAVPSLGKLPPLGHVCEIQSPNPREPSERAYLQSVAFEIPRAAGGRIPLLELIPEHGRVGRGWSGAPVLSAADVVIGVFVQLRDGVVYAVPIDFVLRMEGGEDLPFAYVPGVTTQPLLSPSTRRAAGIGMNVAGMRVARTSESTSLRVGDVIVEVNGKAVSNSGTVAWDFAQASWQAAVCKETPGTDVPVAVLRDGRVRKLRVRVRDSRNATGAPAWGDRRAVMAGELIFAALSFEFLERWGDGWMRDAPEDLVHAALAERGEGDEIVVLVGEAETKEQVYEGDGEPEVQGELHFLRVARVDGERVRRLEDLARERRRGEDMVVEFVNGFVAQVPNGVVVESEMQGDADSFDVVH